MRAAVLAISWLLIACTSATGLARCDPTGIGGPVCARLGEAFDIRIGETAYIADTRLSIRLDSVPEDSRCPSDVQCPWAGNARVALTLRDGPNTDAASVNSTLEPRAVTRWDYRIELMDVRPVPVSGQPISPTQYVIRLLVSRVS
jgi:hypothetical protein